MTTTKLTILIVDDELVVRRLLGDALGRSGYIIELASNGKEALDRLERPGIDLLLLDLQLGDINGVQVMQGARKHWPDLPIIMLTAHGSLPSAIAAVRYDAADYLLKPVSIEELRERVAGVLAEYTIARDRKERMQVMYTEMQAFLHNEGLLQRPSAPTTSPNIDEVLEAAPLRINLRQHMISMNKQPIDMTPTEFTILVELLSKPGTILSCTQLAYAIHAIVEDEEEARQIIRPHIVRLRRKLEADPQQPRFLLSVRGLGYRWMSAAPIDT